MNASLTAWVGLARRHWESSKLARAVLLAQAYLRRPGLRNLKFVLVFVAMAWLGRITTHPGTQMALIWPAAGVAVFWLLPLVSDGRWRRDRAAWLAMAALTGTAGLANFAFGATWQRSIGFGVANLLQALVTCLILTRGRDYHRVLLTSPQRLHRLVVAATAGALVSAPFGPGIGVLAGVSSASLWQYVVRNVVSIFLVGLLALLLLQRFHTRLIVPSYHARLAGILLTSLSVGWMVFVVPGSMLLFLLIPLGALVAYGTEPRTTAWHTLGVSAALVGAALGDNGPLNHEDLTVEAPMVQAIVLVLSIVSMSLVLNREEHARLLSEVEASRLATLSQAQLMERLIFSIGEGVLLVGGDGEVIVSNPAARSMLAISETSHPGELVRVPDVLHHLPGADGEGSGPIPRALAGCPVTAMDVLTGDDDDRVVLSVAATPVDTVEGTQAVVLVRDVTREREETAELTRFAGVVAHDLLNPLTSIQAWAEVVREELQDAGQPALESMMSRITGSAGRMQQMIDDLLDYSVTRKGTLAVDHVNVGELVAEIVEAASYGDDVDATEGVSVSIQAPLEVEADTRALRQVLTNLIGNAVKYTKPGQRPHIEVRTESAPSGMVAIIVADRGIGIPEGQERDIFREFHRAAEHATAYPGTGLGLAICRRIVERHGGTIAARRRPGGGTLVSLTLPGTQACCSQGAGSGCGCGCGENAPESHSAVA